MKHLQKLIYTHKIDQKKYDAAKITKYTIKYLDHRSNNVKENAYLSLLRQYEVIGKDQDPYLHPMKPKQRELYNKVQKIYDSDGYDKAKSFLENSIRNPEPPKPKP